LQASNDRLEPVDAILQPPIDDGLDTALVDISWLGGAFAERACRTGYSAYCVRAPRLFHELHVACGDGSYIRLLARLAKTDLLVIDDWGLAPLTPTERRDLLAVLEDRSERASTCLTSQVPVTAWHEPIGEPTIADSICDRLVHTAYASCIPPT
jgi:DNA replication protein DnaC